MYGNGYSMAIVLDHRSTATSLTGNMSQMSVKFGNIFTVTEVPCKLLITLENKDMEFLYGACHGRQNPNYVLLQLSPIFKKHTNSTVGKMSFYLHLSAKCSHTFVCENIGRGSQWNPGSWHSTDFHFEHFKVELKVFFSGWQYSY